MSGSREEIVHIFCSYVFSVVRSFLFGCNERVRSFLIDVPGFPSLLMSRGHFFTEHPGDRSSALSFRHRREVLFGELHKKISHSAYVFLKRHSEPHIKEWKYEAKEEHLPAVRHCPSIKNCIFAAA